MQKWHDDYNKAAYKSKKELDARTREFMEIVGPAVQQYAEKAKGTH
jgi:hypothetical protein